MTTPGDWPQVRELFHAALELPAAEREAFVRAHAQSSNVIREVTSLLAAQPHAAGFLSSPPWAPDDAPEARRLPPHTRLGHFEVLELLGAGGMGEVYRARDTRLDRAVAIKVLSRRLLAHPEGRERLQREARLVSRLMHPHVCALYDVGVAPVAGDDTPFLVMELVDGETLAARLRRGPLSVDHAVKAGIEILRALDAAHAAGIVHRDLKPGNVMLTTSGVKLLDFGLARVEHNEPPVTGSEKSVADPLTKEGLLLGTIPYMAPEQLRGQQADSRSDVFAFGAVFYEMLTGTRAFEADSDAETIAAILERDPPPVTTRAPQAPIALDRIVATCIAKDPVDRWPRVRDVLRELLWLEEDDVHHAAAVTAPPPRSIERPRRWAAAIALVTVGIAVAAIVATVGRTTSPGRRVTFSITPPSGTSFQRGSMEMALSPDGSRLVFVAISASGTRHLWLRHLGVPEARLIPGTDGAMFPFWSPDGAAIAFFTEQKLLRIDDRGGGQQQLADLRYPRGGSWSRSGTILFAANWTLQRVPDRGGKVVTVTTLDAQREREHAWPVFLPDSRRFLYLALGRAPAQSGIYRGDLESPGAQRLVTTDARFELAGSQLLFLTNRSLVTQPFDVDRGELQAQPIELASGVGMDIRTANAAFAAAAGSVLAYRVVGDMSRLTWYDRHGETLGAFNEPGDYQHPWISSDDGVIVVEKTDAVSGRHTLWTLDLARNVMSRLLSDPSGAHGPVLSPDRRHVAFVSNRLGGVDVFSARADGSSEESLLVHPTHEMYRVSDWSSDGRLLLYWINGDLWTVPFSPPRTPRPFLQTNAQELQGRFSPDMRWVAYTSDESGAPEVYVRRFPEGDNAWRVSTRGGAEPQWRQDGKELFYLAPDGKLMAADVKATAASLTTGSSIPLFNTGIHGLFLDRRNHFVVTRDGQRFMVNVTAEDDNIAPITVVLNWASAPGH